MRPSFPFAPGESPFREGFDAQAARDQRGVYKLLLRTVYCESSGAFVSRALRITGARELSHRWLEPRAAPEVHGIAVCTVVREPRWQTS